MSSEEADAAVSSNACRIDVSANFNALGKQSASDESARCWLGIDEAGRGPVLGPMVYGVAVCMDSDDSRQALQQLGVADSKALTEARREDIFGRMGAADDAQVAWAVKVLSAQHISTHMLRRRKDSLNDISHDTAILLIRLCIDAGFPVTKVFVDTVGPPESYQAKLERVFPQLSVCVAKKADSLFAVVSAASIAAKVTRDRRVAAWRFPENHRAPSALCRVPTDKGWGSGYPGDPLTKQFLVDSLEPIFGFSTFVRFSWSTADDALLRKAVPVTWEDDESQSAAAGNKSIKSFFGDVDAKATAPRHAFFVDRHLDNISSI